MRIPGFGTPRIGIRGLATAILAVGLTACQTTNAPILHPAASYSGYFYWSSERALGPDALQCMQLVFNATEDLPDGRIKLTGVTRYVTGPARAVDFVDAEMIYDPAAGTFEMWERNATSESFVSDGRFLGRFHTRMLFAEGTWIQDGPVGDRGHLSLRQGTDAPCQYDDQA